MKTTVNRNMDVWDAFVNAESPADKEALREQLLGGGYSLLYRLVESLRERIKQFGDDEADGVLALIGKARDIVPEPGKVSPAWQDIWAKLEKTARFKQRALTIIPPAKRNGEWQVLIDNPYENRETACYPGLGFMEAVFIYAKFRPELMENEYVRLQKVDTHLTEFGSDGDMGPG